MVICRCPHKVSTEFNYESLVWAKEETEDFSDGVGKKTRDRVRHIGGTRLVDKTGMAPIFGVKVGGRENGEGRGVSRLNQSRQSRSDIRHDILGKKGTNKSREIKFCRKEWN